MGVSTLWSIHGIYVEYSWDIRMCRLCIGYVSVMCRLSVEAEEERRKKKKIIFFREKFGDVSEI